MNSNDRPAVPRPLIVKLPSIDGSVGVEFNLFRKKHRLRMERNVASLRCRYRTIGIGRRGSRYAAQSPDTIVKPGLGLKDVPFIDLPLDGPCNRALEFKDP